MTDMSQTVSSSRLDWVNIAFLTAVHVAALAGLVYAVATGIVWMSVALGVVWLLGSGISITGGYHRLFSHRSYRCATPLKLSYLLFGAAAMQNSALNWCCDHRRHHANTDEEDDPYNARRGLWWSHIGWVFYKDDPLDYSNVRDLSGDRLVAWQHRYYLVIGPVMSFAVPAAIAAAWGDAMGGLLFAGCIRLALQYHSTFSINSIAHRFGRQPYNTTTTARDSGVVAFMTLGEGYHNFHHKFPGDYRNGIRLFDFDPTKWLVSLMSRIGVTWDLKRVSSHTIEEAKRQMARLAATPVTPPSPGEDPDPA
jgi:stearoyl-CoA desaturase (Delta-9 desaturase)